MQRSVVLVSMSVIAVALAGCRSSASGVYVQVSDHAVSMIQLVQSKDGRLSGGIEDVRIAADGSISDHSNAIEGAADGSQLVLRSTGILGALSPNLGGALKDGGLELTWPGGQASYRRSSLQAFANERGKLERRAARIVAVQRTNKAAETLAATRSQIQEISGNLDKASAELLEIERKYEKLSMVYKARKQQAIQLKAVRGADYAAINAEVQANAVAVQIDAVHTNFEGSRNAFERRLRGIGEQIQNIKNDCEHRDTNLRDERFNSVCGQADQQAQQLSQIAVKLAPSIASAETAYQNAKAGT